MQAYSGLERFGVEGLGFRVCALNVGICASFLGGLGFAF